MIYHADLAANGGKYKPPNPGKNPADNQSAQASTVRSLIRSGQIRFGGNKVLKIYGTLACSSGRLMKTTNRVFFQSEAEAIVAGYRPCGHCLKEKYKQWKSSQK